MTAAAVRFIPWFGLALSFLNFNLPARKLAGKLPIQAPATQNQRYLTGLDNHNRTILCWVKDDPVNDRRL